MNHNTDIRATCLRGNLSQESRMFEKAFDFSAFVDKNFYVIKDKIYRNTGLCTVIISTYIYVVKYPEVFVAYEKRLSSINEIFTCFLVR